MTVTIKVNDSSIGDFHGLHCFSCHINISSQNVFSIDFGAAEGNKFISRGYCNTLIYRNVVGSVIGYGRASVLITENLAAFCFAINHRAIFSIVISNGATSGITNNSANLLNADQSTINSLTVVNYSVVKRACNCSNHAIANNSCVFNGQILNCTAMGHLIEQTCIEGILSRINFEITNCIALTIKNASEISRNTADALNSSASKIDINVIEDIASIVFRNAKKENPAIQLLKQRLSETENALNNLLRAIEEGIITPTTKQRMIELEQMRDEIKLKLIKEEMKKPTITKEGLVLWLKHIQSMSLETKEHKQRLIDIFVNAVYLYDDKLVITFNYKEASKTVTLKEVSGSIIECSGAPP